MAVVSSFVETKTMLEPLKHSPLRRGHTAGTMMDAQ